MQLQCAPRSVESVAVSTSVSGGSCVFSSGCLACVVNIYEAVTCTPWTVTVLVRL